MSTQTVEALTPKVVQTVNDCLEACIDGQKGYAAASADVREPTIKNLLQRYSVERAEFARALKTSMERHGGSPEHHGTAKGKAHRGFMELRVGLEGATDAVILGECERGELGAIAVYDRALAKVPIGTIPADVRALLVDQRAAIQGAYDDLTRQDIARRSAPHGVGQRAACVGATQDLRKGIDDALDGLEQLADEVRVKLHLAGMDAKDTWEKTLEPRLHEARQHAKEATAASKAAIDDTMKALRDFAKAL